MALRPIQRQRNQLQKIQEVLHSKSRDIQLSSTIKSTTRIRHSEVLLRLYAKFNYRYMLKNIIRENCRPQSCPSAALLLLTSSPPSVVFHSRLWSWQAARSKQKRHRCISNAACTPLCIIFLDEVVKKDCVVWRAWLRRLL